MTGKLTCKATQWLKLTTAIACLFPAIGAYADIYQSTDKNGVVIFTDQAEKVAHDPQAKRVEVSEPPVSYSEQRGTASDVAYAVNTGTSNSLERDFDRRLDERLTEKYQKQASFVNYALKMVSPLPQSSYRRGVGSVSVSVAIKPSLKAGHKISLAIDGKPVKFGTSTSVSTDKLIRGEHIASATVVDEDGRTLGSASVAFHVHQTSKIIQDKRKEAERRKEEAKKPWWKRKFDNINIKL